MFPLRVAVLGIAVTSLCSGDKTFYSLPTRRMPEPNPPSFERPISETPSGREARPAAEAALWSIGEPTDEEQKLVELINRARGNPLAEVSRLQALTDPEVVTAYQQFGVDFDVFAADMRTRAVVPPLTPQKQLTTAARGHSQFQLENAVQAHNETNYVTGAFLNSIPERATAAGYLWSSLRESVFAYSSTMEQSHAGLEVDWGNEPGGQQSPPGHRVNNHDPIITEIGAGVIAGSNTVVRNNQSNTVGPRIVTLDFGTPDPPRIYITGVAYYDLNEDGEYDEGEGLPEVRVDVSGAAFYARTTRSGGYGVPTTTGPKTVTFSGANMSPVTRSATPISGSVKIDLALPYAAPLLTGTANPVVGAANTYEPTAFPSVTSYEWRALRRSPFTTVLGAEVGLEGFTATTTGTYTPRTTTTHSAGAASYRLVHATSAAQVLTQNQDFTALAAATLHFHQRFGFSSETSIAAAELSTDGGATWNEIWSRPGLGGSVMPSPAFESVSVPLNLSVGTTFKTRFRYYVQPGTLFFNDSDERIGFFFDEVSYTGVSQSLIAGSGEVTTGQSVNFVPTTTGEYVLQARPKIGERVFPFRESRTVIAQTGSSVVNAVTLITNAEVGPSGKFRVDFSVMSGTAAGFDLERTFALGGLWSRDAAAILATNSPGHLTFRTDGGGISSFVRIRSK